MWPRCGWCVWKNGLIKNNVTGDNNAASRKVKTPIPLVLERIANEHAASGAGRKLVRHGSGDVRETKTTENTQVIVGGVGAI